MNQHFLKPDLISPILLFGGKHEVYLMDKDWKEEETEVGCTTDVGYRCQTTP